eukprot:SAG31_NODE_4542_length_3152_cov_1.420242_1_plen_471_part_00
MMRHGSPNSYLRAILPLLLLGVALFPPPTQSQDDDACVTDADCEDRPDGKTLCDISYPQFAYVGSLKCIALPQIPQEPEFGYFSVILNRSYVRNFTKVNETFLRESMDGIPRFRECTPAEWAEAGCMSSDHAGCEYDRDLDRKECYCVQNYYGNGVDKCTPCPSGTGQGNIKPWFSTCPERSTSYTDCRTHWISHWDTITLSNEVITVKLDQNGLRSTVYSNVSPKWDPSTGIADYGTGDVAQRMLHDCRDSAVASATIDDLSSHCRHLVGISTGGGNEEGAGRAFRYTADEFRLVVALQTAPGQHFILSAGSMALESFEVTGSGEDCGRTNPAGQLDTQSTCGGTHATYVYKSSQDLPMAHHKLRASNAFRADVRGPRGFVRSTSRPYSTSPGSSRGLGGRSPSRMLQEQDRSEIEFHVTVTYALLRGEDFPSKILDVSSPSTDSYSDCLLASHRLVDFVKLWGRGSRA